MSAITTEDGNVSANKQLVYSVCSEDGELVSPIDLTLDGTRPLSLEPLQWFNFDTPPFKMKLTNSGDTMVISGKWANERPYLIGGPLDHNYVFSQVHFHWGSSEHEGSEHTVKGICYPMEMHVVFFKARYLTQAAALRQNDGVIIVVYLFKLQSQSSAGLHWLSNQLEHVVEPLSSKQVSPMPLSSLMVPFDTDYITYWGALVSQNCRHPIMWLVSRSALSVSSEVLNMFRSLLNSRKESMTKNFRVTSSALGRTIFHINPSSDTNHLLLPGTIDPPCQAVIVNYSQTPLLNEVAAKKIFSRGDSNELESKDKSKKHKEEVLKGKTRLVHEGKQNRSTTQSKEMTNNNKKLALSDSGTPGMERALSTATDKKQRTGTKLQRQCSATKKKLNEEKGRKENNTGFQDQPGDCVHVNMSTSFIVTSSESVKENKTNTDTRSGIRATDNKTPLKSRLPVPKIKSRQGKPDLQSSYASYFKRPDSAPIAEKPTTTNLSKPATPSLNEHITLKPETSNMKLKPEIPLSENRRKVISTIPRPLTKTTVK